MALVRYLGPFDAVSFDAGGPAVVARGETVDVPANVAASLCEQGSFELVKATKATIVKEV